MQLMSNGLPGHEHDLYPIVSDSIWIGGHSEYSGLNEGIPYWLNGLIPLAYGLDDDRLKNQSWQVVDYILSHQQSDGWLGPEAPGQRDIWGRFPLCLGLKQLVEADPSRSSESNVLPALHEFISLMHRMLVQNVGYREFWGRVRYPDMIIVLQWLYEKHPGNHTDNLLATMSLLNQHGLSWAQYYSQANYIFKDLDLVQPPITGGSATFPYVHAVNAAQGHITRKKEFEGSPLYSRFNNDVSLLQSTRNGVNWTLTYHGDPAGSVIGDERESGLGPNRGYDPSALSNDFKDASLTINSSELCTAVETMYSLSYLYHAMGDKVFADQCERAAFNALPVSFTDDLWAHQYLVVANQPFSYSLSGPKPFWNTGDQSIVYGMGLPKFLSASFAQAGPNGLAHVLLSPAQISTTLHSGTHIDLACNTTYPFGNTLHYTFTASAPFKLHLRLPSWATDYEILALSDGGVSMTYTASNLTPDPHTGMLYLDLLDSGTVEYKLRTGIRTEDRGNDTISVYHGALLYALDVGFVDTITEAVSGAAGANTNTISTSRIPTQAHDHIITNTKPWNIAIDPSTLEYHTLSTPDDVDALPNPIWAYEAPPNWITAQGCEIADWGLEKQLPTIPPKREQRRCSGKVREVVLRPYGSLKVHMAVLPVMELGGRKRADGDSERVEVME
ncbi:MAG: hypothetical protein Q9201_001200 [Fulgogasparrea decipioides]